MSVETATVRSVCPYCAVGCGLLVDVEGGVVSGVRGDPDHPANFGRICSKGALLAEVLHTEDRLLHPQLRVPGAADFRHVGWDEALGFVAAEMRRIIEHHGPDAVAFYGSGQLPTEDYYLLGKLAKGYIGTNNQDTNSRLCMASAAAAYSLAFGQDGPPCAHSDIDHAGCFLILGANMAACHPVLFQRVKARKQEAPEDVRVIVVDPRRTVTAAAADLHLPVRPGMDVALLNAILHVIIEEDMVDDGFVEAHTQGFEAVRDVVMRDYAPERVADECGVKAAAIREAARAYGGAAASLSLWAMGANQSSSGVAKNLALINLALATGNVGRPGAGPFSLTGQPNAMGGRDAGGLAHTLPGHRLVADPLHRAEMEGFWGVPTGRISPDPGLTAVDMFEAAAAGKVKALWIVCTNPLASLPDLRTAREAMARAELIVVQDAYHPTETSRYAHVLLPAAQWSERAGTMTNGERRVCLLEKAGDPPGEALPDWEILCRFAGKMGFEAGFAYRDVEEVFEEFKETTRGRDLDMSGITYSRLRGRGGLQWPVPEGATTTERLYRDGRFPTVSGRARFHAVGQHPPAEPADAEYPLVLITGRVRDQWHTRTRTGKVARLNRTCPEPYLEIHPHDASFLGIGEGDIVEIRSRRGVARLPARVAPSIRPGTVFAPFHWGELWSPSSSVNDLTLPDYDRISKEPEFKHCAVRVSPVPT